MKASDKLTESRDRKDDRDVREHPMNSETTDFRPVKFHVRTGSSHLGNLT